MKFLIALILTIVYLANGCTAPYWEVSKPNITTNQCDSVASLNFTLNDVHSQESHLGKKSYFNLTSIVGTSSGNSSKTTVIIQNNTIKVSNYEINVNLTFHATRKTGTSIAYNGSGVAHLIASISYSKQMIISDSGITFKLLDLSSNINPNISGDYSPNTTEQNKNAFNKLLQNNITNQLSSYYSSTLKASVQQQVKNQVLKTTFNGQYSYNFDSQSVSYQMGINQVQAAINGSLLIGYNASIIGESSTCANTSTPFDSNKKQGSFFSRQFCEDLLNHHFGNNSILIDGNYSSNIFSFQMKDIISILPDAINQYPGLLVSIYAKCHSVKQINNVKINDFYRRFQSDIAWNCSLIRTGGYGLMDMIVNVSYSSNVGQSRSSLIHNITSASLLNVKLVKTQFDIYNETLAEMYIKTVLGEFVLDQMVGTNFTQPSRQNPKFNYSQNYFTVYDENQNGQRQEELLI